MSHINEHFGLYLILGGLNTGEQRNTRCAARDEPRHSDRLDVAAQPINDGLQLIGLSFEPCDFVPQDIEIRFGLEERLGGFVGLVASLLDLPRRPFRSSFVGLRHGRHRNDRCNQIAMTIASNAAILRPVIRGETVLDIAV